MALTVGKVRCIQVQEGLAGTTIQVNPTTKETLLLWTGDDHTVHQKVIQTNWVSLLRQAMADDVQVSIAHPDNSALVTSVQLGSV